MDPRLLPDRLGTTLPHPVWREGWNEGERVQLLVSNINIVFPYITVSGGLERAQVTIPELSTCGPQNYSTDLRFWKKKQNKQTNIRACKG